MALRLNTNNINIGNVPARQTHSFTTTITNTSGVVINVEQIQPCCSSCSSASLNKYVLDPNETATLTVAYTPTSTSAVAITKCVKIKYRFGGAQRTETFNFSARGV